MTEIPSRPANFATRGPKGQKGGESTIRGCVSDDVFAPALNYSHRSTLLPSFRCRPLGTPLRKRPPIATASTGDFAKPGSNVRLGSGPPDFCPCTLKVPRSAVGSGSGRPEPARPMSQLGRLQRFNRGPANGRNRRIGDSHQITIRSTSSRVSSSRRRS